MTPNHKCGTIINRLLNPYCECMIYTVWMMWRRNHTCTHLLRIVGFMQECLWPTHRWCFWLCPLSGRLMDQLPTGTASWLPTHNQISSSACHRWKSKWVILHKLAVLHPKAGKFYHLFTQINNSLKVFVFCIIGFLNLFI